MKTARCTAKSADSARFCHRDESRAAGGTSVVTHTVVASSHTDAQASVRRRSIPGGSAETCYRHMTRLLVRRETGLRGSRPVTLVDHNGYYRLNSTVLQRVSSYAFARLLSDPELVESNTGKPGSCPIFRPTFQNYVRVSPTQTSVRTPADLSRAHPSAPSQNPRLPDRAGQIDRQSRTR